MVHVQLLIWDPGNVAHIARHDVQRHEVEEVCHGSPVDLKSYKERIVLIGPTQAGRMLAVVLQSQAERGMYYPVTARPASRRERRYYQEQKRGTKQ